MKSTVVTTMKADLARMRELGRLIAPHRRRLAFGVALFLVARGATLLVPLVSAPIIDRFVPHGDRVSLDRAIVTIVLLTLVALLSTVTKDVVVATATNRMIVDLRLRIQQALQRLPLQTLQRWKPGYWLSRVDGDVHSLAVLSGETAIALIEDVLSIALASMLIVYTSLTLAPILALFAPLLVVSAVVLSRRMTGAAQKNRERWGRYMTFLEEELRTALLIRALGVEERRARRGARLLDAAGRADRALILKQRLVAGGTGIVALFLPVAVLWLGMRAVMAGELSLGRFIAFNTYVGYVTAPIQRIVNLIRTFRVSSVSFDRVREVLALDAEDARDAKAVSAFDGSIELRDVSFVYNDGRTALTNVSATFRRGMHVALVGPNGSGKSTLLRLAQGYETPTCGAVLLDGADVQQLSHVQLRALFGYVPAGSLLLDGSLRENLTFGAADDAELETLLAEVGFFEGTGLTRADLDRQISDVGARLSEGQRQLVALVRLLLRKPLIGVIDEGMSFLDGVNHHRIMDVLRRRFRKTTLLWATHGYERIGDFDAVMVLNRGRLESFGPLDAALRQSEWFRAVFEKEGAAAYV